VLQALAERAESTTTATGENDDNAGNNNSNRAKTTELKHADIFRPLPALLKKLVWEGDWTKHFPVEPDLEPREYLKECETTLLFETMNPLIEQYCTNAMLVESANQPFVATNSQRRMLTTQRRALNITSSASDNKTSGGAAALLGGKAGGATSTTDAGQQSTKSSVSSSKAISQLRVYLSDSGGSSTSALSYRPKMLYALLSIIIARHGALLRDGAGDKEGKKKMKQQPPFLGGADHLHCTLVSDILLSAGGPLPKAYHHVHQLARIIDECVDNGNITNAAIKSMQATLKEIFMVDHDTSSGDTTAATPKKDKDEAYEDEKEKKIGRADAMTNALQRQLNHIITAGIGALKESDPQSLFLNPVTNKIAPGYSKIIKRPMCISVMENKIDQNKYKTVDEWESDVKLMFGNCIKYNSGESGQWFRGEAERQAKVFRDEIYPQARKLYQTEIAKRKTEEVERKRKVADAPELVPLEKATKKRRKDIAVGSPAGSAGSKQEAELVPSMPALAFLLLTDPFLVRIILARILREVRIGIVTTSTVPCASSSIPSLLQFMHMASWSSQICAVRAKRYFVPSGGVAALDSEEQQQDPAVFVPYATLRQDLPLLLRLLLEAELDKRVVVGGDLFEAAQSNAALVPKPIVIDEWVVGDHLEVAVTLLQGALVHISQPGNTSDASLAISFPKFTKALSQMSERQRRYGMDGDDRLFFQCLIRAIVRHKAKLSKPTRDSIVKAWVSDWIAPANEGESAKKNGTMTSSAHECFVMLLNEWSRIGNQILPRDTLLDFVAQGVKASNESESRDSRKFASIWTTTKQSRVAAFEQVKSQYIKMLSSLPAANAAQWRTKMGLPPLEDEHATSKSRESHPASAKATEDTSTGKETNDSTPMQTDD